MNGVARCVVGYSGGIESNPTYSKMKDFTESILVEFDPNVVTYERVLQEWARMDYPWVDDRRQYRSALFYLNEEQRDGACKFVQRIVDKAGSRKVYIDIEMVTKFYLAEEYHQDFLAKRRDGFGD